MTDKQTHTIVAVHITDRLNEAIEIQKVLTQYGDIIKTRLGLHEPSSVGMNGLLLLDVIPPADRIKEFEKALQAVEGVEVKTISFEHDG